jgi:hypothetical protein
MFKCKKIKTPYPILDKGKQLQFKLKNFSNLPEKHISKNKIQDVKHSNDYQKIY